jgi:hypothetical protein
MFLQHQEVDATVEGVLEKEHTAIEEQFEVVFPLGCTQRLYQESLQADRLVQV